MSAVASWSSERVASLATDQKALDRARKLTKPASWSGLASDEDEAFVVGSCRGSSSYDVRVALADGAAQCSCPSRQQPCKHALALLLMLVADPTLFGLQPAGDGDDAGAAGGADDEASAAGAATPADPDETAALLDRATKALAAGDREAALFAALSAWRAIAPGSPQAAVPLAEGIDALDAALVDERGGVADGKRDEIHQRFLALDPAAPEPLEVGRLMPVLTKATNQQATERLKRIAAWPPDPRVSRELSHQLEQMKVLRSESGKAFWGTAIVVLGNTPDFRTLVGVRRYWKGHIERYGVSTRNWMRKQVKDLRERLERELSRDDPLPAALASAIERFCRDLAPAALPGGEQRDAESLLHAIYQTPDDDELRAVYADVLTQLGDPRGELITLQLARAAKGLSRATKRERQLLDEHGATWLGSLGHYLLRGGLRFERGFVTEARWNRKRDDDVASTLDDPAWSTVQTLRGPVPMQLVQSPVMRSLRAVEVDTGTTSRERSLLQSELRAKGIELISP